jgi:hypothetical protein
MAKFNSSLKIQNFIYDFTKDGGAVSAIPSGVFLPLNFIYLGCVLVPLVAITSGGAAIVNIGDTGAGDILSNANGNTGTYIDYNVATFGFSNSNGSTFAGTKVPNNFPTGYAYEVMINIVGAALTAGKFRLSILYLEY